MDSSTALPRNQPPIRRPRWISLPYLGCISHSIGAILRRRNLRPAYYLLQTLKSTLGSIKDPVPRSQKSGSTLCPATIETPSTWVKQADNFQSDYTNTWILDRMTPLFLNTSRLKDILLDRDQPLCSMLRTIILGDWLLNLWKALASVSMDGMCLITLVLVKA